MNRSSGLEISAEAAVAAQAAGAVLLDVREAAERLSGYPRDSLHAPMSEGFDSWLQRLPRDRHVLLFCAAGVRSLHAAVAFRQAGFARAESIAGGMHAWQALQLPIAIEGDDDPALDERYSRHWRLPEVGVEGQRRLLASRVLLVGAGGLGSPIALYLAAAGVGHIRVVDDDRIERSNLQRQVVHRDADIGMKKVVSAKTALLALNPAISVEGVDARLSAGNVDDLIADCDVVVDGADNFPTRYLINAACCRAGKPWVYGGVQRFEGQVSVFAPHLQPGVAPCYRCLFSSPPGPGEAPNCAEAGVLGVLPGIVGTLQSNETIKLLLGIGQPLIGRLQCFDGLSGSFREVRFRADADCPDCGAGRSAQVQPVAVDRQCAL
jgi:sulfur-carrier protein adenylyltransferase/sulfurtransferase